MLRDIGSNSFLLFKCHIRTHITHNDHMNHRIPPCRVKSRLDITIPGNLATSNNTDDCFSRAKIETLRGLW